jgi:hypothetical protein
MATRGRTFRGKPVGPAAGYLAQLPVVSSMVEDFVPLPALTKQSRGFHFMPWKHDAGVVIAPGSRLQSGTTPPGGVLASVPESDASAPEKVPGLGETRMTGESAAKAGGAITPERIIGGLLVLLQAATAALVAIIWWNFTSTVADVGALQDDVRQIMVQSAKSDSDLNGKIDGLASTLGGRIDTAGAALGGRIDTLGTLLGGKIDTATATNAGQFELIAERLDSLQAAKPKPK